MFRRNIPCSGILPAFLIIALCLSAGDAAARGEAACRVVTTWNYGCSGSTRNSWDNMVLAWYDTMTDSNPWVGAGSKAYSRAGSKVNGSIVDSDFTDTSIVGWGNDTGTGRPDEVDAFMVGLHGIDYSGDGRWLGRVRVNESGNGNCNAYQRHMEFGDGDLEFLALSSCYSMDKEDWWSEWSSSFKGLHQIEGFHGIMWISSGRASDYRDFAYDSFRTSVASSWIDNMYDSNASNGHDQCPVARTVGLNSAESSLRLSIERYSLIFPDPPGPGSSRHHRTRYIQGCDPKGKGGL